MSERDPVVVLLKQLDRPVVPRPEFADALRERLLAELVQPDGLRARRRPRPWLTLPARRRRPLFAGAVALALAAAALTAVLLSRPSPASALDVIHQARRAFATTPPFEATLRFDLNPDSSNQDVFVPKGASGTLLVSYGGPKRFRTEIVAEQPRLRTEARGPGSYDVYDGRRIGFYDAERKFFNASPAPKEFRPLEFLSWHGVYPDWEQVCRRAGSKVLPETRIAGRDARHIRCGDYRGGFWQLWIDRQTGLLLKIVGQVGGGETFLQSLGPGTSAKGGFEVEHLRYNPSFPAGTFTVVAPSGALDYQGRLQAAMASVPPFRAVVSTRFREKTSVDKLSWLNDQTWRLDVLAGQSSFASGGPGSFVVAAHGRAQSYNARENSVSRSFNPSFDPIRELLPEDDSRYSTTSCPIVGRDQLVGRDAVRRRCKTYEVWVDRSSGVLLLKQESPGYERRVRGIAYHPVFSPGTFRFVPPPGSRKAHQLENDPYYKTTLAPGKVAANWSATRLGGGAFRLSDLRGKPALLLLFSDTCPAGDPTCDVFPQLERVYEEVKNKVAIVWVDLQGSAEQARKIARHNHLTLPVVVDHGFPGAVSKAWKIQAYPYWLLLDSHGRVIQARFKPQTRSQLQQLMAKAKR
jgi:hypothetical protein